MFKVILPFFLSFIRTDVLDYLIIRQSRHIAAVLKHEFRGFVFFITVIPGIDKQYFLLVCNWHIFKILR